MAARGWSTPFDDPIPLPRGRQLVTLKDAAGYIMKLSRAEQNARAWQTPMMHARIGVMRALNRHVERVFNPDRKDSHWGKRKLARDR